MFGAVGVGGRWVWCINYWIVCVLEQRRHVGAG